MSAEGSEAPPPPPPSSPSSAVTPVVCAAAACPAGPGVGEAPVVPPVPPVAAAAVTAPRFPRTPHIEGSAAAGAGDDDQRVALPRLREQLRVLAAQTDAHAGTRLRVVVQEKVDGANVGVHFPHGSAWEPVVLKRGGPLGAREKPQYGAFRDWVFAHAEALFAALGGRFVLFGEWVWCTHAVEYDALPSFFLAFDVFDTTRELFLPTPRVHLLLRGSGISVVQTLADSGGAGAEDAADAGASVGPDSAALAAAAGAPADAVDPLPLLEAGDLSSLIRKSAYGREPAEGLYVRIENDERVLARYKFRRDTFLPGRDNFRSHVLRNRLAPGAEDELK